MVSSPDPPAMSKSLPRGNRSIQKRRKSAVSVKTQIVISATLLLAASPISRVQAGTFDFTFTGSGVSGTIQLTYGSATDGKYPQALEVTGISGVFSDSNGGLNIVNAPVGPLVPLNHAAPEPSNLLAPDDFSKFAVSSGLPHGSLSYDNLFWPGGSPQTATSYPPHGGFLDIYGLLFEIGGAQVVNVWSNGEGPGGIDYGVGVATADKALDYVGGGVVITPEPGPLALLGTGLAAMFIWRRRSIKT
jgi:hypothetical protein